MAHTMGMLELFLTFGCSGGGGDGKVGGVWESKPTQRQEVSETL